MNALGNYLRESWRVYFSNAQSVRDYRAQLRGVRPLFLWFAYLAFLILITAMMYSQISTGGRESVTLLQAKLQGFYIGLTILLACIVCLVSPGLTASAITIERQRRSLDLLFSAPVENRYLLVGKLISSLRYSVMLLVLSLPILSVCVVMGGATWQDVLQSFLILLLHAINFCAIGLLISAITVNVVSSIIWTYIACGMFVMISTIVSAPATGGAFFGAIVGGPGSGGRALNEAPWIVTLNPFGASMSGPTYSKLWALNVPNWVFLLIFSVAFCKILILGAGSYMSYYRSPETRSLRVHGLVYAGLFGALVGFPVSGFPTGGIGGPTGLPGSDYITAFVFGVFALMGTLLLPQLSCFGFDDDRKYRPNGMWSIRKMFDGTPAGNAPYLLASLLCFLVGFGAPMVNTAGAPGRLTAFVFIWAAGLYFMLWAWGQYSSAKGFGLKSARTTVLAIIILLAALPLPIIGALMALHFEITRSTSPPNFSVIWYPAALGPELIPYSWIYGLGCALIGVFLVQKAQKLTIINQARFDAFHNPQPAVEPPPVVPSFDLTGNSSS
jgi:hypothetical protein